MGVVINGPMIDDLMEAIKEQTEMFGDYDGDTFQYSNPTKLKRLMNLKAKVKAKRKFVRKQKSKMRRKGK